MKQTVLNVCYSSIILMLESLFIWQLCFLNKPLYFINKIYFHTHLQWGGGIVRVRGRRPLTPPRGAGPAADHAFPLGLHHICISIRSGSCSPVEMVNNSCFRSSHSRLPKPYKHTTWQKNYQLVLQTMSLAVTRLDGDNISKMRLTYQLCLLIW